MSTALLLIGAQETRAASPRPGYLPLMVESSEEGFRKTTLWEGRQQPIRTRDLRAVPKSPYRKQVWWYSGIAYDIPVIKHPKVDRAVRKLIVNRRKETIEGIKRSGRYLTMIRRLLQDEKLPLDLVYMVAQESNFNVRARSRMNAVGLWQFIGSTGRNYGLKINRWIDERRDPILSTKAALRYLKHLYGVYEDWSLAMAAYNSGEKRVNDAIKKAKRRGLRPTFWKLDLPRETENYVPSVMAQAIIYNQRERYRLGGVWAANPMEEARVRLPVSFSLEEVASRAKVSFTDLRELNASLYRGFPPMNQEQYTLYLPSTNHSLLLDSLKLRPEPSRTWKKTYTQFVEDSATMTSILEKHGATVFFRIKRGDNLWDLAKKHGTSVGRLKRWNDLNSNTVLRVNQRLKLYVPTWRVFREIAKLPPRKQKSRLVARKIRVPRGTTLSLLARRYKTSVHKLKRWNRLRSAHSIKTGQRLIVGYRRLPSDTTVQRSYNKIKVPRNATLSQLAERYRTSVKQLMRWNGLSDARSLRAGQKLIVGYKIPTGMKQKKTGSIRVPRNSTLSHLALKYRTTVKQLMRWNGMKDAKDLRAGMKLIVSEAGIRKTASHQVIKVRSGDTLSKIAERYGTSVKKLVALNDLRSKHLLRLNQRLRIPNLATNES